MNLAHVLASFYLLFETDLAEQSFKEIYSKELIVGSKVSVTLPDGTVHSASLADLIDLKVEEFEDNKKATKQSA
jgi:hypothetical protein